MLNKLTDWVWIASNAESISYDNEKHEVAITIGDAEQAIIYRARPCYQSLTMKLDVIIEDSVIWADIAEGTHRDIPALWEWMLKEAFEQKSKEKQDRKALALKALDALLFGDVGSAVMVTGEAG